MHTPFDVVCVCLLLLATAVTAVIVKPHLPFEVVGPTGTPVLVRIVGDEATHHVETLSGGYTVQLDPDTNQYRYLQSDFSLGDTPPSSPHLLARLHKGGHYHRTLPNATASTFTARSINDVASATSTGVFTSSSWVTGSHKVLLLGISFSNKALLFPVTNWVPKLFQDTESSNAYFEFNSYNKFHLIPAEDSCGTHDDGVASVTLSSLVHPNDDEYGMSYAANLAVRQASSCVDWQSFDTNLDGIITTNELHLILLFSGTEAAQSCATWSCPKTWACSWTNPLNTGTGITISDAVYMGELADCACTKMNNLGTFDHELGHTIGLPDLYDTMSSSSHADTTTFGDWSLMNSGNWCSPYPCNLDPWSRAFLGWVNPVILAAGGSQSSHNVTVLGTSPDTDVVQLRQVAAGVPWVFEKQGGSGEFYLVEHRDNTGSLFDTDAPGSGILMWHIKYKSTYDNIINSYTPHMIEVVPASGQSTKYGASGDTWKTGGTWDCKYLYDYQSSCVNMFIESTVNDKITFNKPTSCNSLCPSAECSCLGCTEYAELSAGASKQIVSKSCSAPLGWTVTSFTVSSTSRSPITITTQDGTSALASASSSTQTSCFSASTPLSGKSNTVSVSVTCAKSSGYCELYYDINVVCNTASFALPPLITLLLSLSLTVGMLLL